VEKKPSEEKEGETLRIVDKRRFILDEKGEIIERTDLPPKPSQKPPPPPPPPPPTQGTQGPAATTPSGGTAQDPAITRIFLEFLNSMAHSALVQLGEIPDPASGLVRENLEGAQQVLEFLSVLRKKTEGNLTPQETRTFDTLLYELMMRFRTKVERFAPPQGGIAGGGGKPSSKKGKP
jgi:hypothetical protein